MQIRVSQFEFRSVGVALTALAWMAAAVVGKTAHAAENARPLQTTAAISSAQAKAPRIINLYNFIRNSDYRLKDSEAVLFEATQKQLEVNAQYKLPATWALQYDALVNPKYQALLKEKLNPGDEIACWWEIPRPLVQKAGIAWRGHDHEWDSTANVGFSPGYTPEERRKLVDVYMAEFKAVFGRYPKTAGSWYIDEVTLAYMSEKYGIIASCNCKDQIGTDGYTLWGGYWNGAYYPSKVNAYMPAQTAAGQIDVPVFRMLGSDPIYQYWQKGGMWTLEPVYPNAGGQAKWTDWFLNAIVREPCLAYGYTQAGQENSFGWEAMKVGYTLQAERLAKLVAAGEARVETLEASGRWFREQHKLTPATATVALEDFKGEGRKSVWYNSRYYRVNWLWEGDTLTLRDLHRFDEKLVSPTHETVLTEHALAYGTLPVMDGASWGPDHARGSRGRPATAGGIFNIQSGVENAGTFKLQGEPKTEERGASNLVITQGLEGGGVLTIDCGEKELTMRVVGAAGKPIRWELVLMLDGNPDIFRGGDADRLHYSLKGFSYDLHLLAGKTGIQETEMRRFGVPLKSDANGVLQLGLDPQ